MLSLILISSFALKCLFFFSYHSTDFEVHRNWIAITHNLPLSKWYTEDTSKWTLDYPPLFAWFEWILSQLGALIDPAMVIISKDPYISYSTILFQRLSVIFSELLLFYSLICFFPTTLRGIFKESDTYEIRALLLFAFNFGIFIVDHIHFQYNGFLFGIYFMSITHISKGSYIMAGVWFTILLNMKHIFVYIAPVYFLFLLLIHCFHRNGNIYMLQKRKTFILGTFVCFIFFLSFGPFIVKSNLLAVIRRLFPFHRGLCHIYWAPNFWAIYNIIDKILNIWVGCGNEVFNDTLNTTHHVAMTSGLSGEYVHYCLPIIRPIHTIFLTALFMLPSLWICINASVEKFPNRVILFIQATISAAWASFLFGWHVHEKAVLMITLPLTLLAILSRHLRSLNIYVTFIAHLSLIPLIHTPAEQPAVLSLYAAYTVAQYILIGRATHPFATVKLNNIWLIFVRLGKIHIYGIPLFLIITKLLIPLWLPKYEFLPLMLTSVYCAVGMLMGFILHMWITFYWIWNSGETSEMPLCESEGTDKRLHNNKLKTN